MMACVALSACSSTVRKPRLEHPGPAGYQQANAEVFDPFPENDLAPAIDGGRPRDVGPPRNQVERAQQFLRSQGLRPRQEVPLVTAVPAAAPVVIGTPLPAGAPAPAVSMPRY
jgi:hypothetical protein